MKATETYLRRATRGLWGRKRREVREELEAHLAERIMAHRIGGLTEADAVERALAELGSPQEVSVGMTRLYTLPTVMGSGAALAALSVLVVALLPNGVAQALPGTHYWPSAECVKAIDTGTDGVSGEACVETSNTLWLDREVLRQALEPQGVTFNEVPFVETDEVLLGLTFPPATLVYVPLGGPNRAVFDENGVEIPLLPDYLSLWSLLQEAAYKKDLEVEVSGWDNPTVRFNDVSFQVGTGARPMSGVTFYESYLGAVLYESLLPLHGGGRSVRVVNSEWQTQRPSAFKKSTFQETVITVPDAAPGVYGIATRLNRNDARLTSLLPNGTTWDDWDDAFLLRVAQADSQGNVSFSLPKGPLRFVEEFTNELTLGAAVLVRLGGVRQGAGWYDVVSPERITLQ